MAACVPNALGSYSRSTAKRTELKTDMPEILIQFVCEFDENYTVMVEDDGRVAYAYLMEYGDIIGDVWLYNVDKAPLDDNWAMQPQMPFLNPAQYLASNASIAPINNNK